MSELMLKDTVVLTLRDVGDVPSEIIRIKTPECLPVCLEEERCTTQNFRKWLSMRQIPASREGLDEVKAKYGEDWNKSKNYASLSDHYWIRRRTETYAKVNFFTRTYSHQIGDMFFSPWKVDIPKKYDPNSPDLTTGGVLKKRWIQHKDYSSSLIKAGSVTSRQEPLNEVLVSCLCEQLGVPCVKYDMHVEGLTLCSICDNFINTDTELVPAYMIYGAEEKADSESIYQHLLKMCEKYQIPGASKFLDWLIYIDYLTGNEDRNLSNLGFIRDVNTMKFIGAAPIYDSGNAYWNNHSVNQKQQSRIFGDVEKKIFKQLRDRYNIEHFEKLDRIEEIIELYPGISDSRKEELINGIEDRNKLLLTRSFEISR